MNFLLISSGDKIHHLDKMINRVGSSVRCDLKVINPFVSDQLASLVYKNDGSLIILNHSDDSDVLVNDRRVNHRRILFKGDIIDFAGVARFLLDEANTLDPNNNGDFCVNSINADIADPYIAVLNIADPDIADPDLADADVADADIADPETPDLFEIPDFVETIDLTESPEPAESVVDPVPPMNYDVPIRSDFYAKFYPSWDEEEWDRHEADWSTWVMDDDDEECHILSRWPQRDDFDSAYEFRQCIKYLFSLNWDNYFTPD